MKAWFLDISGYLSYIQTARDLRLRVTSKESETF